MSLAKKHDPGHKHGGEHDNAYEAANAAHFDKEVSKIENIPHLTEIATKQGQFILSQYKFDPESTVMLNFACGTGWMDKDMIGSVKRILGIDISQGMVDAYNKRAGELGLTNKMSAKALKLKGEEGELGDEKFDIVICTMAYHHFESPLEITKLLEFFLKPGGWLIITDGLSQEGNEEVNVDGYKHIIPHKAGFEEAEIVQLFEEARLEEVTFQLIPGAILDGRIWGSEVQRPLFLVKGRKSVL